MKSSGKAEIICRAALKLGELVAVRNGKGLTWRFGRRKFNACTVARIIDAGDAVRDGDVVRAAQ